MKGWMETWRGIVAPWECDLTEHFTIAYYFDRLSDAAAMMAGSLAGCGKSRAVVLPAQFVAFCPFVTR